MQIDPNSRSRLNSVIQEHRGVLPKVLNVAETIKGGVATYLAGLSSGEGRIGCQFSYLIPESQRKELAVERCYFHSGNRSFIGTFKLMYSLIAIQRQLKADIVFAHSTFAGIALCLARPFLGWGIKTVYCPHGWAHFREMSAVKTILVRLVERAMSYVPSAVVNISAYEHNSVMAHSFSRCCTLITNAVHDVPDYAPRSAAGSEEIRVLFVGRMDRQKGIDFLFDAISLVGESSRRDIKFDVVGDSVVDDAYHVRPDSRNVKYHGWLGRDEITKLYQSADVLVMPSRWEGFGLCAIEAFRVGTPVLARRCGALPDIVSDGFNGYLFDGDGQDLAAAILRLQWQELQKMRANARSTFVSRFQLSFLHDRYKLLFADLLSERWA